VGHQEQRPLQPQPLHELIQCLAQEALEHPVEVEWGKTGRLGDLLEPQGLGEVPDDVVDGAVDALDVVNGDDFPGPWSSAQDLASRVRRSSRMLPPMNLGNFSVSLAVKDIKAAKAFYEKLDFTEVGGTLEQNWIVLQNGNARIGLFQGMLDKNILTFNPGWGSDKETLKDFEDVRELQRTLKGRGLTMAPEADETTEGPAYFMVTDPDGNTLLFDQHVPSPKRQG
jgi:lactoylglutathione lyase